MEATDGVLYYVPVDYAKFEIRGFQKEHFFSNPNLSFIHSVEEGTGEIRLSYAIYRGMKIKVYESGRITLQGSLHKYWNHGKHNHNDFSKIGFDYVVNHIEETFKIDRGELYITAMEIGVNVIPPVQTSLIINNTFMHKGNDFEQRMSNDQAKYHGIKLDKFEIKIYDKAKQYKLPSPLMRIEVKYSNWSAMRKRGIVTLDDFIRSDKEWFRKDLIRCWEEILFFDPTAETKEKWSKYSNPNFWREKRETVSRATFSENVSRLRQLNKSGMNVQKVVGELIDKKLLLCSNT